MKRLLFATTLSLMTAGSSVAQTVILVRHAEKVDASADPVLSEAGQRRAFDLAVALGDADLTHVFTSPLQRTVLTARPAAEAHAINPEVISFEGGTEAQRAIAKGLHTPRRERVVIDKHRRPVDVFALVVDHAHLG